MDKSDKDDNGDLTQSWPKFYWWHWTLGLVVVLCLVLLAPHNRSPEFANLKEGNISYSRIIAPFDFEILKSPEELKKEREDALKNIPPIYIRNDTISEEKHKLLRQFAIASGDLIKSLNSNWIYAFLDTNREWSDQEAQPFIQGTNRLYDEFGFWLSGDIWRMLFKIYLKNNVKSGGHYFKYFNTLDSLLTYTYHHNIIQLDEINSETIPYNSVVIRDQKIETQTSLDSLFTVTDVISKIKTYLPSILTNLGLSDEEIEPTLKLFKNFISPNLIYDDESTELRRKAAIAQVPLTKGIVKMDELIIDRHMKVTAEHIEKLKSLSQKRAEMNLENGGLLVFKTTFGQVLFSLIIVCILWLFIAFVRPPIWNDWKLMLLLTVILILSLSSLIFLIIKLNQSIFLFPIAISAMMIAILVDRGVALGAVVLIALSSGFLYSYDYQLVFINLVIGGVSILALRRIQKRNDILNGGFYIGSAYILLSLTLYLITESTSGLNLINNLGYSIINATLSPILVLGFVPLFENLFRVSTELTLLELLDLNQPLLRELAINAPGTYHHSLLVGNLAESGARAIGANTLLTRAGAYYHDIGKMEFKEYFIENQSVGSENIHNHLTPSRSAEIIVGHISNGLLLADKYKLPPQIKAFIAEHHGKTRLMYFLAKAQREQGENVREEIFRYPGPKPQTKETAIVMLADVVEAATRSLEQPTPEELQETVRRMINVRVSEGDLDESPLTLRELTSIEQAFMRVLLGIYHQRIRYPEEKITKQIENH